ncbi:C2H2 zinc finger [Rhizoctonia solani]|uniref:C2H2 zinc finger n=1 Tax=Rhizoctonia solani TaxID=456999 RepID=A0A8H8P3J3_9AGAM|nr:C2H2 zinc finger [Rhizoctonia solani]QRW24003.1 C2H2 zinc finger [Rhizoctonia solani]
MSAQFALDPALASNSSGFVVACGFFRGTSGEMITSSTDAAPPATAAPSSLTKTLPKEPTVANHNPNPAHYSIFPALPPLPGWGPFPGPIFAPPGPMPMPVPMYMVPGPWHHVVNQPPPMQVGLPPQQVLPVAAPPTQAPTPVTTGAPVQTHLQPQLNPSTQSRPQGLSQPQSQSRPQQTQPQLKSHYPPERNKPHSTFPLASKLSATQPGVKARPRRPEPPPLNPAATASPHYQNPGGFGGVYTPPSHTSTDTTSAPSAHSHYSDKSLDTPTTSTGDLGRPFACGTSGCSAAFDRKSDCERHRRTHAKGAAESRPFRCSRPGCEAAFDRKDALMRHERNERTHLVRQTQPGRIKRPTRPSSKSDVNPMPPSPPRRMSTRKRKNMTPGVYADPSESDFEDDEGDYSEGNNERPEPYRARESIKLEPTQPPVYAGTQPHLQHTGLSGPSIDGGMEDLVVIPPDETRDRSPTTRRRKLRSFASDGRVRRPAGAFTGTDEDFANMQAVEALQAALQQIEAEKGHESVV